MKKKRTRTSKSRTPRTSRAAPQPRIPYLWIGVAAVLLVALIAVIFTGGNDRSSLATVNGEEITQEEFNFQYSLLPESYRSTFTEEQVLEQIIDEVLVVQAARNTDISVSQEEVHARVQSILAANEISLAEFQENLAQLNVSQEQFEALIEQQLLIDRYLNRTLEPVQVDEMTLEALYEASQSQYTIAEHVTVRHVLISSQRTDAALIAKQVYDAALADGDFCELAQNMSDDRGSRDTCGEYTFPRGFMDPVFEDASFSMEDGEVRLIQTQFGYHIIKRINMTPARVQAYDEVRSTLVAQYESAERARQYRVLLNGLRSEATISYANGTTLLPTTPTAMGPAEQPTEQPAEQPVQEPAEPVEEPTAPEPVPTPESATQGEIFSCIAGKAVLYGTSWSTDTQQAQAMFGRQNVALPYVECNAEGAMCEDIQAYPTWVIDGQQYLGRMTLEQLKNAAKC